MEPVKCVKKFLRTLNSLSKSVESAGGDPNGFTIKRLEEMTIFELIAVLGVNDIVFQHVIELEETLMDDADYDF